MESREHMVAVPRWTLILRIASLVLAIIILGLNAYGIHYYAFDKLIFSLVTCLLTFIIVAYQIVATLVAPNVYNMWAFLALDIFMVIFWLIQFALVGSLAADLNSSWNTSYTYYYWWYKRDLSSLSKRDTTYDAYWGALVAGAVFGAFNFVLFTINLIIFSIALNKHRLSGAPTTAPPGYGGNAAVPAQNPNVEKYQQVQQPQLMPQQPQPVYAQSPYAPPQPNQYTQPQQPQYPQQPQQNQYGTPQQAAPPTFQTPYTEPADPVNRGTTVSPMSTGGQQGYGASELQSPQAAGNPNAVEIGDAQQAGNPNAAELGATGSKS